MKISVEELVDYVICVLSDEFEAKVSSVQEKVIIDFNGVQKFGLAVKKI